MKQLRLIADKYRVLSKLGEGGSGTVYLVEHIDLGVRYALKLLDKLRADDKILIDNFRQEAEILLRFSHPGSAALRDFGRTDTGLYYMTMDLCEGKSLKQVIHERKHLSVEETLDILDQLLSVLDAAHQLGVVHCDIKPENIMLQTHSDGSIHLKVLDFGIATLRAKLESTAELQQAFSIGTPEYMSPEQAQGEHEITHLADVYAAGIVMYELLSGDVPFHGKTVVEILLNHLIQPLEPLATELSVPFLVESIIAKALHKDKSFRFASAAEFRQAVLEARECLVSGKMLTPSKTKHGTDTRAAENEVSNYSKSACKARILCLDDDEMIVNVVRYILEHHGYQVLTATNYSEIHQHLFGDSIDLMLSDVQMPGLSGTKICKMIKETMPNLKIYLFSNLPEKELEQLSDESKADGWISKGTKPEEWVARINLAMDTQIAKQPD